MGRNNGDFQHSAMYHGSPHPFSVGDIVLPSAERGKAYATNRPTQAEVFGGFKDSSRVYKVEPLDHKEVETWQLDEGFPKHDIPPTVYYMSKKGFRVTGVHDGT